MDLLHSFLELLALIGGETGIEQRRLIGETIPVIGHHAAVAEPRLERAGDGPRLLPAALGIVGRGVGLGRRLGGRSKFKLASFVSAGTAFGETGVHSGFWLALVVS